MSGYSKTPLFKKLGYKDSMRACVINAPPDYSNWILPAGTIEFNGTPPYDIVHLFVNERSTLFECLAQFREEIAQNGMIWVSWYKKAAKLPTEITEDQIREAALPIGLVDVKVCAIDERWSGLKLVIRKELRNS